MNATTTTLGAGTAVRVSGHNNRWSGTRGADPVVDTGMGNSIT